MGRCEDCGENFDVRQTGTWRQVVGWVVDREQGGPNQVRERTETGRVVCPPCGKLRAMGVDPNQNALPL